MKEGESKGVNKALLRPILDFHVQFDTHTLDAEKSGQNKRERQEDTEDFKAELKCHLLKSLMS